MGYLPTGLGDVATTDFNSTKYPGICKPSTVSVLATFKRLQTQLNRVAHVKQMPTIAVDGDIGPGTVTLVGKLRSELVAYAQSNYDWTAGQKVSESGTSCTGIASVADVIANVADSYADSLNAPASAPAPAPAKPPMLVTATGLEVKPPIAASLLTAFESAPTTHKVAALAIFGGIGYVLLKKPKRRK